MAHVATFSAKRCLDARTFGVPFVRDGIGAGKRGSARLSFRHLH